MVEFCLLHNCSCLATRALFLKVLSVSVNLSAKQLMHPTLTKQVWKILHKTALDMKSLKIVKRRFAQRIFGRGIYNYASRM